MFAQKWNPTLKLTVTAMFIALIFLLMFMGIGILPLPFMRPTILHIPVIVGAILLGPKYGAVLGFGFGLASMLFATYNPGATSFVFSPFINMPGSDSGNWIALVIAFVPRILVGVVSWYVFAGLNKLLGENKAVISWAVAAGAGALTNTVLVMHGIFFFFGETWNAARATPDAYLYRGILAIISANGIPEAIAAIVITPVVLGALVVIAKRMR